LGFAGKAFYVAKVQIYVYTNPGLKYYIVMKLSADRVEATGKYKKTIFPQN